MQPLRSFLWQYPRTAAAIAFGSLTMLVTHFAWLPDARTSGLAPILTISAGAAHAVAGALTGRRLLHATGSSVRAALIGAATSFLAVLLFAPCFAIYLSRDTHSAGPLSFLLLTLFTGVFSFLGAGWALLLVSAGVGWGLSRLAAPRVSL